jgi:hypothetical protein
VNAAAGALLIAVKGRGRRDSGIPFGAELGEEYLPRRHAA